MYHTNGSTYYKVTVAILDHSLYWTTTYLDEIICPGEFSAHCRVYLKHEYTKQLASEMVLPLTCSKFYYF